MSTETRKRYSTTSHNLWCVGQPGGKWAISCGPNGHGPGCADAFRATFAKPAATTTEAKPPRIRKRTKDAADMTNAELVAAIAAAADEVTAANARLHLLRKVARDRRDELDKMLPETEAEPKVPTPNLARPGLRADTMETM